MPKQALSYWARIVGLEKRLFLVDGVGALLSATMLGGVLASFPEAVGMPRNFLLLLAGLALVFAAYSFSCYRWAGERWRSFLRVIGSVNIMYCFLTVALMFAEAGTLRWIGAAYFVAEITVLLVLSKIELEAAGRV